MPITVQHTKETLCLAHIYAAAAMAGINFSATVHDYGVDGDFVLVAERRGRHCATGFSVDYQAKATVDWELKDEQIVYDLEAKTYNDIVTRTPSETTLILILLCLPRMQSHWHGASLDETTLRHCCYWHTFQGQETPNGSTKRIYVPVTNILTPESLKAILAAERQRRQTQCL